MMTRTSLAVLLLFLTGITTCPAETDISGKDIFDKHCIHCHANGEEYTGTRQLAVTRGKDKAVLEQRDDLTAEYIRYIVRNGLMSMPPFKPSNITDKELKALTDYLTHK